MAKKNSTNMEQEKIINQIKDAVYKIEPDAEIILYGSRARGDATDLSDWDLLILIDGIVDDGRVDEIRYQLYEIEWELGDVISSIIQNRDKWHSFPYKNMPIYKKVEVEGILLS